MNRVVPVVKTIVLLLGLLASVGCGISGPALRATMLTEVVATKEVAFKSYHGRYVTAMDGEDGWVLGQEIELRPCGWFTLHHLANGKVALLTCHERYVTSPGSGKEKKDWLLGQEPELSDCGQFDLYELGSDRVVLKSCAGRFLTASDGGWGPDLEWVIVAETSTVMEWELFTVLRR